MRQKVQSSVPRPAEAWSPALGSVWKEAMDEDSRWMQQQLQQLLAPPPSSPSVSLLALGVNGTTFRRNSLGLLSRVYRALLGPAGAGTEG